MKKFNIRYLLFLLITAVVACKEDEEQVIPETETRKWSATDSFYLKDKLYKLETFEITQYDIVSGFIENNFRIRTNNKIIYTHPNIVTFGIEVVDLFEDNVQDILLHQITNVGGVSELIMFDTIKNKFFEVTSWYKFNNHQQIDTTNYFYSYHGSGCADYNWGSELIKYENYVFTEIAHIIGIGCEREEVNGIFIYEGSRYEDANQIESYLRKPGFHHDKWDFIDNYWKGYVENLKDK